MDNIDIPTKENHVLEGIYTDAECTKAFGIENVSDILLHGADNLCLYTKWIELKTLSSGKFAKDGVLDFVLDPDAEIPEAVEIFEPLTENGMEIAAGTTFIFKLKGTTTSDISVLTPEKSFVSLVDHSEAANWWLELTDFTAAKTLTVTEDNGTYTLDAEWEVTTTKANVTTNDAAGAKIKIWLNDTTTGFDLKVSSASLTSKIIF